ncbi:MAG TPA: glycosyltransferase family 4 protein [Mucilaginibacter sp.]|nr:glycosyltransferase family 4 protein [Mucilaginibacter sp.]
MNILVVNWAWYPTGGDWTYVENVVNIYKQKGHHVIPFSMKDDRNLPSQYNDYFIENIDYKKVKKQSISAGIKVVMKSIYSFEAQRNLERLLNDVKIDFAHINVIHHYITPTILKILKKRNIPVIWTLHEYTPICPDSIFVSHGEICERCYGGAFYNCITHSCKKGSYLASTVAALENYVHKYLNYYALVDHYVCPSVFQYEKYKQFNFFNEKLVQVYHGYNYAEVEKAEQEYSPSGEKYTVFVGRLEKIKGVHTLLRAMLSCPDITLKIVGDGTQEAELKQFKEENGLNNVEFLGKKNKRDTLKIIKGADFLICPSECYEVLGFTVVEAMALGKAVIGAAIGGIPEMVIDQVTGLLFEPGNVIQLFQKIQLLNSDSKIVANMGENAREHINVLINNETHYEQLKKLIPSL